MVLIGSVFWVNLKIEEIQNKTLEKNQKLTTPLYIEVEFILK